MNTITQELFFDKALIQHYDTAGPRYTSYPTALAFRDDFSVDDYFNGVILSNEDPLPAPLSLYFHIPFCDTICFYCACNKIATKDYTKAETYLHYLFQEIEMQACLFDPDRQVEQLHWGGGTPTFLNHNQIRALMAKTRHHFKLRNDDEGDYSIEIDPRSVSKETIAVLREVGFNRFSLGVQDVNKRVQIAVNRVQTIEQTFAIVESCRAQNARSISLDLIYGLPYQTQESFAETLEHVINMSPDRLSVFNYAHMPHIFKPQRRIDEKTLPSATEKLAILQASIERLTQAGYVYIGMDHFAKPNDELAKAQRHKTLHRNFQGYTTHADCDLIGLGVSSISSVNECYSQNEKTLEAYYRKMDEGIFPIKRGLNLDFDDTLRRSIIQQLSCHFTLDFAEIEEEYKTFFFNIRFNDYFQDEIKQLRQMMNDHLLTIDDEGIVILPAGRLLVRNICMVFDIDLREKRLEQRFSKVI